MIAFAIRNDGLGWRAVNSEEDLLEGEIYSEQQPAYPEPENRRIAEIKNRLMQIDMDSVRPLRAILANTATQQDNDKLEALDAEAAILRAELAAL